MNDIKFDSLASLDFGRFARATPADYPAGRYSATITNVVPQTVDSKGKFTLRFQVQLTVDPFPGKPNLRLNDLVSFVGPNGFMWAGANVFCDLAQLAGQDRDETYKVCQSLARALESANHTAIRDNFLTLAAIASTFAGNRVAPNIEWVQSGENTYANVKGSKTCPSYVSAANEVDPAASFTGDDIDSPIETPKRGKRTLVQPKRK